MEDYVEKLWSTIKEWANKNAEHYVEAYIAPDANDPKSSVGEVKAYRDYVRVWMTEMFLAKEKEWFTDWYPAVHTTVQLKFAGKAVKVSHVTGPDSEHTRGVKLDYAVTDLMPFSGGTVAIDSGLIGLKGTNSVLASINILQDFSSLVAAPLAQALDVAQKVSAGMGKLVTANNGEVRLAFHRELVSGGGGDNQLKAGFFAVIQATRQEIDKGLLSVRDSQLWYGNPAQPLTGFNFMLFRIEVRSDRDDWRFPTIEEAMHQAIDAALQNKQQDAENYKKAVLMAVWQSPDLAPQDRRRVANAIEAEIQEATQPGRQAVGATHRSLNDVVRARGMSLEKALREPPLTFAEVIGEQ